MAAKETISYLQNLSCKKLLNYSVNPAGIYLIKDQANM